MQLPVKPDDSERKAIHRLFETHDGQVLLALIERNAAAYMRASCDPASDAASRQRQGAYLAMTTLIETAKAIPPG